MTDAQISLLDRLKAAAARAQAAETQYRREATEKIARLETERAFAFRKLNLLTAMADAMRDAGSEEAAAARGLTLLRDRIRWSALDEARNEVLSRFASVAAAVHRATTRADEAATNEVGDRLAEFEVWHLNHRGNPFWALFEQELPELPLVEV